MASTPKPNEQPALGPCPFCGNNKAYLKFNAAPRGKLGLWFVNCGNNCCAIARPSKEVAVTDWNNRIRDIISLGDGYQAGWNAAHEQNFPMNEDGIHQASYDKGFTEGSGQ